MSVWGGKTQLKVCRLVNGAENILTLFLLRMRLASFACEFIGVVGAPLASLFHERETSASKLSFSSFMLCSKVDRKVSFAARLI